VKKVTVVPKDLPQIKKSCIVEMEFWEATEPIRSGTKVKTRIIKIGVLLKMISPVGISNIILILLPPCKLLKNIISYFSFHSAN
jgi:hypothetical protein